MGIVEKIVERICKYKRGLNISEVIECEIIKSLVVYELGEFFSFKCPADIYEI